MQLKETSTRALVLGGGGVAGVAWELGILYHYRFSALFAIGEWKRCALELPGLLREARERGDLLNYTAQALASAVT